MISLSECQSGGWGCITFFRSSGYTHSGIGIDDLIYTIPHTNSWVSASLHILAKNIVLAAFLIFIHQTMCYVQLMMSRSLSAKNRVVDNPFQRNFSEHFAQVPSYTDLIVFIIPRLQLQPYLIIFLYNCCYIIILIKGDPKWLHLLVCTTPRL